MALGSGFSPPSWPQQTRVRTWDGRRLWTPPSAGLTSMRPVPGKRGAGPGRAEPDDHALGRSRGGLSTKVHLASDSRARPLALHVTAGQAGDAPAFEAVMARTGFHAGDSAVFLPCNLRAPPPKRHPCRHSATRRPGRTPPAARPCRRSPAGVRCRGVQAAQHRRAVHQPPQAMAWFGDAHRQARPGLPGGPAPGGHLDLGPPLSRDSRPTAWQSGRLVHDQSRLPLRKRVS